MLYAQVFASIVQLQLLLKEISLHADRNKKKKSNLCLLIKKRNIYWFLFEFLKLKNNEIFFIYLLN